MGSILTLKNANFEAVNIGQIVKSPITVVNDGKYWNYSTSTHLFTHATATGWQDATGGSNRIDIPEGATYVFGIMSSFIADSSTVVEDAINAMGIRAILFSNEDDYLLNTDNNVFVTKLLTKKEHLFLNNEYSAVVFETATKIPNDSKYLRLNWGLNGEYDYNNNHNIHTGYGLVLPEIYFIIE